ncbi:hypothetical protein ACJRO7_033350 [Eucalyptus globulus]|uniref:Uncharacterized protein n=1 Tax=Eucalyptus globulus TaxID=34317 RepID=A0ABD3JMV2_EUCGL
MYSHSRPGLVECSLQNSERCSERDITINQASVGMQPSGIPIFSVEIKNECSSACTIANVHLHCGEFSSDNLIRPEIFKRLDYDDCLVNNGAALSPGQILSFKYSTTRMNPSPFQMSTSLAPPYELFNLRVSVFSCLGVLDLMEASVT